MAIEITDISKTYGGKRVLEHFNLRLEDGAVCCLMGKSGIGKTTLLRILMGLEAADTGRVSLEGRNPERPNPERLNPERLNSDRPNLGRRNPGGRNSGGLDLGGLDHVGRNSGEPDTSGRDGLGRVRKGLLPSRLRISAVFQEDRLLDYADALKNIRAAADRDGLLFAPEQVLDGLLEREAWRRPVGLLSGGMRRRVAIARALAAHAELILMDEPFTGLDEKTRAQAAETILRFRAGRTLLVVTHQETDAALLGAEVIRMEHPQT